MAITGLGPEVLSTAMPREHPPRWWLLWGVALGVVLTLLAGLGGWWLDSRAGESAGPDAAMARYGFGQTDSARYEQSLRSYRGTFAFATSQPVTRDGRAWARLVRIQLTPEAVRALDISSIETRDVVTEAIRAPGQTEPALEELTVEGRLVASTTNSVWGIRERLYSWREGDAVVVLHAKPSGAALAFVRAYLASLHGAP